MTLLVKGHDAGLNRRMCHSCMYFSSSVIGYQQESCPVIMYIFV